MIQHSTNIYLINIYSSSEKNSHGCYSRFWDPSHPNSTPLRFTLNFFFNSRKIQGQLTICILSAQERFRTAEVMVLPHEWARREACLLLPHRPCRMYGMLKSLRTKCNTPPDTLNLKMLSWACPMLQGLWLSMQSGGIPTRHNLSLAFVLRPLSWMWNRQGCWPNVTFC